MVIPDAPAGGVVYVKDGIRELRQCMDSLVRNEEVRCRMAEVEHIQGEKCMN